MLIFSLRAVTAPLALYYGANDWMADEKVPIHSKLRHENPQHYQFATRFFAFPNI